MGESLGTQDVRKKVLFIEDDAFLRDIFEQKFLEGGFEVTLLDAGAKALESAHSVQPDIILLDILMPDMDGYAVMEALKQDEGTKEIPIIVISNLSEEKDRTKARDLGAVKFLTKSNFLPEEVLKEVKATLREKTKQ